MGVKELRSVYGANSKAATVLNRAVRAEIPGGDKIFEAAANLRALRKSRPELEETIRKLEDAIKEMKSAIARKYELKSVAVEEDHE